MTENTTASRAAEIVRKLYPHLDVPVPGADGWSASTGEADAAAISLRLVDDGITIIDWDDCHQPWSVWLRPDGTVTVRVALPAEGYTVNGEPVVGLCAGDIETIGDANTTPKGVADAIWHAINSAGPQWQDAYQWARHTSAHQPHYEGYHADSKQCSLCRIEAGH